MDYLKTGLAFYLAGFLIAYFFPTVFFNGSVPAGIPIGQFFLNFYVPVIGASLFATLLSEELEKKRLPKYFDTGIGGFVAFFFMTNAIVLSTNFQPAITAGVSLAALAVIIKYLLNKLKVV